MRSENVATPPSRRVGPARVVALALALGLAASAVPAYSTLGGDTAAAAPDTGGLNLAGDGSSLLTASTDALAPGLTLTDFRRLQSAGWVTGHVMRADLSTPTLKLDVLDGGSVSGGAPVSEQITGSGAIAAVNGDYFDMNYSGAPVGTNISPTTGVRSAAGSPRQSFTITDGVAAVQNLLVSGTVAIDGGAPLTLGGVNTPSLASGKIGWYTAAWGAHPLSRPLGAPDALAASVAMVTVKDGVVESVTTDPAAVSGPTSIPDGTGVLIGREAGAATLGALTVGQQVDVTVGSDVDLAVGGSQRMIVDGVQTTEDQVEAARTAVGVSRDGTEVTVVSIDGRQGDGRGMTIQELGRLLLDLGAYNAVNLDGGGSTTLIARRPGTTEPAVINRPSDGTERAVANSLAFFSTAPATGAKDVKVAPASTLPDSDAVFPGLGRTLSGVGLDANNAGVAVSGTFSAAAGATITSVDGATARVIGATPGATTVSYTAQGKTATTPVRVLGDLQRLRPSSTVVALPDPGQTAAITVSGVDGDGFSAPLEAADVAVTSGPDVTVTAEGRDAFRITPTTGSGSATVTFTAGGRSVDVAVTIGYRSESVADFSDGADWKTAADRATGTMTTSTGPNGEPALALDYDFTTSTATRGFYAVFPEMSTAGSLGRQVAGQPQALTLWLKGDGSGAWPRIQLKNGAGTTVNLDGPFVDFTGWKQIRFPVPAGTPYPLSLQRIRMLETKSTASYKGHVEIAGLEAVVAPDVEQPAAPVVHDPVVVANGSVDGRGQRIAVMSDAQFVGRNPDSDLVQAARRTLREIVAAKPDFLVIDGDFVDEASPADFALAKEVLDEEVGDAVPYLYVPGNHEVMGGSIANFQAVFGATNHTATVGGTRIITLNSSAGTFRGSDPAQLAWFDDQLDAAAADRSVTGVLVFAHHPADDPQPDKASQLGDRYEAAAFTARVAEFRSDSGKSAAVINGHVGAFSATSTSGVSQLINGNSGKSPSGTPATGGFTGWTLLGLNPSSGVVGTDPVTVADRTRWMRAEIKPRVDSLRLTAPAVLTAGETAAVSATLVQDGTREVPVAWPVSAQWGGDGVVVDDGLGTKLEKAVAATGVLRVNPETGEVTALAAGTATLTVTVNGVTATADVRVAAAPGGPGGGDPGDGGPGNGGPGDGGPGDGGPGDGGPGDGGPGDGDVVDDSGDGSEATAVSDAGPSALAETGAADPLPLLLTALLVLAAGGVLLTHRLRRRA
ncbi:phosphodiester glycosidase family protein [Leifsonia sp. F6_8S_P_1B]|uniref:Phosphodiester glycosidase family protein n=1 Tax=Leifsonia williamsii TaxID=3035919 RepID=A0ABT8K6F3_9MICO|nr:phosphodiester glycosidase family protein [Leifsonia williamsii]MDN4613030.1 phosphodiester glycosidase family protein [Leifsonia williamsii]